MAGEMTRVGFSNLEKILYPKSKITKKDVITYFIRMAPLMLPHLANRPVTTRRFPDGIDSAGFFQKNAPGNAPEWIQTYSRRRSEEVIKYILCNDLDTLLWLANLAAIEIHVPLSRLPSPDIPDLAFFDIDPEPPATFHDACRVAHLAKKLLEELEILSFVKTSGKKGLHVMVPLRKNYEFGQVRDFVHGTGMLLQEQNDQVRSEFSDSREPGTVFVDYLQNSAGKTMVAPYSLRPVEEATVSTPLEWNDLSGDLLPEDFNILSIISRKEDPWKEILKNPQEIRVI